MNPPPKNRGWLWYFLLLAVLTILATATLAIYNIRQQLKPEQFEAAQRAWKEKGPANYVFTYTIKKDDSPTTDHYLVKVRGGKTYEVLVNGMPLKEERLLPHYGMPKLHESIERFLEIDAEKGRPKTYTRAIFNPTNGALAWYVRRVMMSRQRLEITLESFHAD